MAFNGTRNFEKSELVHYLESIGMRFGPDLNAYTSFDETVYRLTVPTDSPEIVETAFQILEDWATGLRLEAADIEAERGVVIEEWRSRLGAQSRLSDAQIPVLLKGSRYEHRLPIGLRETLETVPSEALVRFYERWYRPDLMAVVAVGDFDPALIEGLIRGRFGAIPRPASAAQRPASEVPPQQGTVFLSLADPELTISRVDVLHKLPARVIATLIDYRQTLVEDLANSLLNARFSEITQKLAAPFVAAFSSRGGLVRAVDTYSLGAVVQDGGVPRGLEALLHESERVARHGFTPSEFDRSKLNLLRSYERAYAERERTNSGVYADDYVSHFLKASPIPGIEFEFELARLLVPGISLEEVDRLSREWLTDENRVVLVSMPEKDGLALPGEGELRGVLAAAEGAVIEAYVDTEVAADLVSDPPARGAVVQETQHEAVDVTEWRLANGVRVLLKATDFRDDEIVLTGYAPGGLSLAADAAYASASFAAEVVRASGIGAFSATDLQRALAGKVVSVAPSLSEFEAGVSGSASPRDVEAMFQLI
jgi:zinc protease